MKINNADQLKLAECEATIERTLGSFHDTGLALLKIRDERLYRVAYSTFEAYCEARWDMKRAHAYRLIESARIAENLSPIGDIENLTTIVVKPATESQARELAGLNPDDQRKVWQKAVETAPEGRITAAHIREMREALINSPEQETLFTLEDYRQAINHHVSEANRHRSVSKYHIRQATLLQDEALKKFGEQIPLPFDFVSESEQSDS